MFKSFEEFKDYEDILVIMFSMVSIAVSGLYFGLIYYVLGILDVAFKSVDCVIDDNVLVESCQELFALGLYPFLALKDVAVWASFFFIFALVIGMLVLGYRSGRSPVLMGYSMVMIMVTTYGALHLSNFYRVMLDNAIFRDMMIDFSVYNLIMLNFPWFMFIVALMSAMLGIVNFQRTKVNAVESELDY